MKQSMVRIPKDLANQLRILAINQDRRLSDVLKDAIIIYIAKNKDLIKEEIK